MCRCRCVCGQSSLASRLQIAYNDGSFWRYNCPERAEVTHLSKKDEYFESWTSDTVLDVSNHRDTDESHPSTFSTSSTGSRWNCSEKTSSEIYSTIMSLSTSWHDYSRAILLGNVQARLTVFPLGWGSGTRPESLRHARRTHIDPCVGSWLMQSENLWERSLCTFNESVKGTRRSKSCVTEVYIQDI